MLPRKGTETLDLNLNLLLVLALLQVRFPARGLKPYMICSQSENGLRVASTLPCKGTKTCVALNH